jgi:hypothetical protein
MRTKEFLSQAFYLDRKIESNMYEVQRLNSLACNATACFDGMPKATNSGHSKIEEAVVKICELEEIIGQQMIELVELKKKIRQAIESVGDVECETLLSERYLSYKTWEEIAAHFCCCLDNVYRIHRKALSLVKIK